MPLFRYIAASTSGSIQRGELAADSAYHVRVTLRKRGLQPVRVRESAQRRSSRSGARRRAVIERLFRNRRRSLLAELYENLAALVATGTPLVSALELLANTPGRDGQRTATLCRGIAEEVRQGSSLERALRERPEWFSAIDASLIRSAEQGGELDAALADLGSLHSRTDQLRSKLAMALAYPALLLVFGAGVVAFLTTNTLPQIAGVLSDAGAEHPGATRALLWAGTGLREHWILTLVGGAALGGSFTWLSLSDATARVRLRTPLVGMIIRRSQTGAMSLLLARLLRGGVALSEALDLVRPTLANAALRDALHELRKQIETGAETSDALRESGCFDPVFVRVVEVGQASGELPSALETIGARLEVSATRLTDRLAACAEPAAILVLAAAIGFVVYASLVPMLQLTQAL